MCNFRESSFRASLGTSGYRELQQQAFKATTQKPLGWVELNTGISRCS